MMRITDNIGGRPFDVETIPDGKLYVFRVEGARRQPIGVLNPSGVFEVISADGVTWGEKGPGGWSALATKLRDRLGLTLPESARPPWAR